MLLLLLLALVCPPTSASHAGFRAATPSRDSSTGAPASSMVASYLCPDDVEYQDVEAVFCDMWQDSPAAADTIDSFISKAGPAQMMPG